MVLVSNEWQNKCEDEFKATANTATTGGTITTTTTTTANTTTSTVTSTATIAVASETLPATATATGTTTTTFVDANTNKINQQAETIAGDSTNSRASPIIPDPTVATTTLIKTIVNDNANNEQNKIENDKNFPEQYVKSNTLNVDDINSCKISEVENLLNTKAKLKEDNNLDETVLNYNNKIKIMAENIKEFPLKEEKELEESESSTLISNHSDNNKNLEELNSYPNSNTSTLQTSSAIKQNIITQQQQQQVPLSCPITPQALSSALQTALNATNNANNVNNTVAAAGLQPNFLSQLALTANVAGLQKSSNTNNTTTTTTTSLTAKQLNQSFNMLDSTNNQTKSDSNLLESTTLTSTPASTVPAVSYDNNGQAKIVLTCEGNSHPFQTRTICLTPKVECMVGRLIAKSKASETNAIFDCKVLSRKHAVIWYTPDGKFWVKDTKSSNGTFINDNKLGDEEAELHFGDIVKFGVDVLENSRKEVHGCIIACVKLYLPDGREAISIDWSVRRSQYSGEGRISYDELHRLNLYIQETSQREKVLTSKLCNIQNVLDATRKNSALCWQSMITEDQLLHRIHSLEKKLQFMEKNVPENVLRNEVLKLLDDKSTYQLTAKEALRKVYQERCEAMQMLAKMESAYNQSDNECSLLRDQIMNSKQTLQDVNSRLLRLETEYNEYKDEMARQQQETKEREEQRLSELTEKLRVRELECEDLKKKISELLIKRADQLDNEEELLEKQAMEKLDAAIANMDLGEDDESDDGHEVDGHEVDVANNENKRNGNDSIEAKEVNSTTKQANPNILAIKRKKSRPQLSSVFGDNLNGIEDKKQELDKSKLTKSKAFDDESLKKKSPPKRVKETTIMKWLQNSDLNKNEGSFDIFKAICNENENDEEEEIDNDLGKSTKEIDEKRCNFTSKLKNVQLNLQQLEAEIEKEMENETETEIEKCAIDGENIVRDKHDDLDDDSSDEDDDAEEGARADKEFIIKRNGKSTTSSSGNRVLSKENKKYLLLKSSVNMLREAYNEIWDSVREQDESRKKQSVKLEHEEEQLQHHNDKEESPPSNIKGKTQLLSHAISPTIVAKTFESSESDITESDSDVESLTRSSPVNTSAGTTIINVKTETANNNHALMEKLQEYQSQVETLNEKLQQTEMEAQHTLEIMQVECDDVKIKMESLNKIIDNLKNDKMALERIINESRNNSSKIETSSETSSLSSYANEAELKSRNEVDKELELEEDPVLNAINVTALEREEELILYKERLDEQQKANIELRNEIALLQLKANVGISTKQVLLKQFLPYSFVVLAIIVYFLTTYF